MTPQELKEMERVRKELAEANNIAQVVSLFNYQELDIGLFKFFVVLLNSVWLLLYLFGAL